MDKETREFLDRKFNTIDDRFNAIDKKFDENRAYVDQKLDSMDQKFDSMDQKFDSMDQKFDSMDQKFDSVDQKFDSMDQKFDSMDEKIEGNKRYFGVVAEGLRNEIQQVAEGHQVLLDGQERIIERLAQVERELGSQIKFSYAELDQRLRILEGEFQGLKGRLDRLEAGRN